MLYGSRSPPVANVERQLFIQFRDSPVCDSTIARYLENQFITAKIAGKTATFHSKEIAPTQLRVGLICQFRLVVSNCNCLYASVPHKCLGNAGHHQRTVYIDESGFQYIHMENHRKSAKRRTRPPRSLSRRRTEREHYSCHIARHGLGVSQ